MAKSEEEKAAEKAAKEAEKEEAKAKKEAEEAEKEAEKEAKKGKEVVVLSGQHAKLTRAGEVYKLYNGLGQLLQTGGPELQKVYGEFIAHNVNNNRNAAPKI